MRGLPSLRMLDEEGAGGPRSRLWLAFEPTDMRCGFDQLAERVRAVMGQDPLGGHGEFLGVRDVAGINVTAQGQGGLPIEYIAQAHLAKIVPPLLVMAALRHRVAGVGGGNKGVKVGGAVSQQTPAHELFFFPQTEQAGLRFLQGVRFFALHAASFSGKSWSKQSQKAWEEKRSGSKPQRGARIVC
jgi:IS66 Orf2 like protein